MSALNWRPGTIYAPGSVVRPNAVPPPPAPATLENPDFEAGASGWTVTEGALAIVSDPGNAFNGTYIARLTGPTANSAIQNNAVFPVVPGQQVTARCMIRVNAADRVGGTVAIVWLDSSNSVISSSEGNQVNVLGGGVYRQSAVTAIAPAGAVACKIAGFAFALQSGTVRFDAFSIVYQPPVNVGSSLVYRAVQPNVGTSDATEPAWPTTVGQRVNDGTVVWEAIEANIVLWEAEPILITGGTEPAWPTVPGAVVEDNGIIWRCIGRNVRDERCPNSKVVAIGAAKVFAADDDIIRYSATGNPLDWSTQDDAGFLPSGLQQNGANRIDVLNLYRSNLVALNASTFQMWQIDPDPEQMALLDAMEGIGSVWQKAAQPVSNDLFLLSALGVRTVGIAVGSTNLQAGDVGMPIDSLVQEAVAGMPAGSEPKACYYPAAGQYWLLFPQGADAVVYPPLTIGLIPECPMPGQPLSFQYDAAGGLPPYTWSLVTQPPGWAISTSGLLTGAGIEGVAAWTVRVEDSLGQRAEFTQTCDGSTYYTTTPYSFEVVEELQTFTAPVVSGRLFGPYIIAAEGLDVSATVVAGELKNLFVGYPIEGLDTQAQVTFGRLSNTFINYLPEALDTTATITAGELRTILIQNTMAPEGLDTTTQIIAGTLT